MRNQQLIHSIALSIVDKHYEEEECLDNHEEDDFHSMFEPSSDTGFWDAEMPKKKTIISTAIICSLIPAMNISTLFMANKSINVPLSLTYILIVLIIDILFYGNMMRRYTRNLPMISLVAGSMFLSSIILIISSVFLLNKIFS